MSINIDELIEWLKGKSYNKICLQFPDNLMIHSSDISLKLRSITNLSTYVLSNTKYENCCPDKISADQIDVDSCIHFGHSCLSNIRNLPTFYVFPKQTLDVNIFVKEFENYFDDLQKKIIFFYDVSYAYLIETIFNHLKPKFPFLICSKLRCKCNVPFVEAEDNENLISVIGRCFEIPKNESSENYDAVYLGSDDKTFMTLSMSISVNTWHHFSDNKFIEHNVLKSVWYKKRNYLIEKIKEAYTFGIIIGSLNIENYLAITKYLKNILQKLNRKVYLLNVGTITPIKLANFQKIDVFIAITCPESSIYDLKEFYKPIVTPFEVDLAFNSSRSFSPLNIIDFKDFLPGGRHYGDFYNEELDVSLAPNIIDNSMDLQDCKRISKNVTCVPDKSKTFKIALNNSTYFQSKSWDGLEQKLGETEISLAMEGRAGLPTDYENEHM